MVVARPNLTEILSYLLRPLRPAPLANNGRANILLSRDTMACRGEKVIGDFGSAGSEIEVAGK